MREIRQPLKMENMTFVSVFLNTIFMIPGFTSFIFFPVLVLVKFLFSKYILVRLSGFLSLYPEIKPSTRKKSS